MLSGTEMLDGEGKKVLGTMPDNGAISSTMDGLETKSVSIPAGYTSGGTVSLDSTIDNTANSQATKLAELKTILQGKAAGSGGDKTPGTCTVAIRNGKESGILKTIYVDGLLYETMTNGEKDIYIQEPINAFEIGSGERVYINNVLHGGLFILFDSDASDGLDGINGITTTNAEYLGNNLAGTLVFRIGDADAIIELIK